MSTTLMGFPQISGQDLYTDSTIQQLPLGVYAETNDGRGFRYCKVGAVSTVPGKVYQAAAEDTTNQNPSGGLAVAAAAVGTNQVTLTGSLTLALNLLAGGTLTVNVTPGLGQVYRILSNTAVAGAANCVITLEDPLRVALTTASKVDLKLNPYNGVVVTPATMTSSAVGVAPSIITNGNFGWLQVRGIASCLQTGTGTAGTALGVLQGGTIGSLAPAIAGTAILARCFGTVITGEYGVVDLCIS
jgi:hypothetical protein